MARLIPRCAAILGGLLCAFPAFAAPPADAVVVFNEINYNPAGIGEEGEWIELHNEMGVNIDLSGWRLAGGVDYTFTNGTVLNAGAYLVVAKNPAVSGVAGAVGPWTGSLSNDGETLRLRDNNGRLMDELTYGDKGAWPIAPDGSGATLSKAAYGRASSRPESWTSSSQHGGTPNGLNFPELQQPVKSTPITFNSNWKYNISGSNLGTAWRAEGYDDTQAGWQTGQAAFNYGGAVVYGDPAPAVAQGVWSMTAWTGDADSQIASTKTYTHKIGLHHTGAFSAINGVVFDSPGPGVTSGANWSLTGATNAFTNNGNGAGANNLPNPSGSRQLCTEFFYGNSLANGTSKLDLSALTPGQSYIFTLYATGFGGPEGRPMQITTSDTGSYSVVDENITGSGAGILAKYWYKAPADGKISFSFLPLATNATWHHYAFSNEVAAQALPEEHRLIEATPTVAAVTSELTGTYNRQAVHCIDGSGLDTAGVIHGKVPDQFMWLSAGSGTDPLPASITFDLGASLDLSALRIWNYNEVNLTTRSANSVLIETAATAGGPFTAYGTVSLRRAFGTVHEIGERVPLSVTNVRQVRLTLNTNYGDASQYVGLSEVRFYGPGLPPPPTPAPYREALKTLFNTGVTNDLTLVPPGTADPHYTTVGAGPVCLAQAANAAWVPNDPTGQWVGLSSSGNDNVAVGQFTYRTTFDTVGYDFSTLSVKLSFAADNQLDLVKLNGTTLTGITGGAFNAYAGPYTIANSSILNGSLNTVDFTWSNGGTAANPGGLRVKWDATAVPQFIKTALASNPRTSYFRQKFNVTGAANSSYFLTLKHVVDDGAVFYLNGQEIHRVNMPAGAIDSTTPATSDVVYPKFSADLALAGTAIHPGDNTLAVELHQADPQATNDAFFGATLSVLEVPNPAGAATLSFNEIAGAATPAGGFFVELKNPGGSPFSLDGYRIRSSSGVEVVLTAASVIPASGVLALTETALGFRPLDGEKLFLVTAAGTATLDAVVIKNKAQGRDGNGRWLTPSSATAGGSNVFAVSDAIVINEIMYHHAPTYLQTGTIEDPEEWVELFNRSGAAVDLTGWKLAGGVDFSFAPSTTLGAGQYLVVAKNLAALQAKYPAIAVVGSWSGSLSNSDDIVRLEDANGNAVDEVHYYAGGRWDGRADGGGSSLELRQPAMDNAVPEAWVGSDEGTKSSWQTISYQGTGAPPAGSNDPTAYNEFIFGLLNAGEFLIDDISVKEVTVGNRELITNGTFSTNTADWRLLGNHGIHGLDAVIPDPSSGGNNVLKVVATGSTEHMHNQCQTTLKSGGSFVTLVNANTYNISFRARWISGSPRLQTRLYFNRLVKQHLLPMPVNNGTPGAPNSRVIANAGPTFQGLSHYPPVPAGGVPVTVRISAADPDSIASMTLKWRLDGVTPFTSVAMSAEAAGRYSAQLPAQTAGSLVQFYIEATDGLGAVSTFPAAGAASRAMIKWNDGFAIPTAGHAFRILMPTADADVMHSATQAMSNHALPCTVVYRENEVFYDAGVRLRSSQRGRLGDARLGFYVEFDPTHLFRGVHTTINMDRSAYGQGTTGSGTGQVDIVNWQFFNRAGGIPSMYNDMPYVFAPRSTHNGSAMMTMAEFNDIYLDSTWDGGGGSPTFKFDLVYFPTTTNTGQPDGLKNANPDDVRGVNMGQITSADKEAFRWNFLIGNARNNDDYSRIQAMNAAFAQLAAGNASTIASAIDIDQWLRASAAMSLVNSNDSYSTGGLPHNLKLYVRPDDGRVLYLPWDPDFSKMATNYAVAGNADLVRIVNANVAWKRLFYAHLHDIMAKSYSTTYLTPWINHFASLTTAAGNWNEILTYVNDRRTYVLSQCAAEYPAVSFAITTGGGGPISTSGFTVDVAGDAWLDVFSLRLQGASEPLPVTWTDKDSWKIAVPVQPGTNTYVIEGLDYDGNVVHTASIVISGTGTVEAAGSTNIVVSEINYHPADPTVSESGSGFTDPDDFEFIELQNISSTAAVNLTGCRFVAGVTYTIPNGTQLLPGARLVIPRRLAAFQARHPGVPTLPEYYVATGNVLDNGGEEIALVDAGGQDIQRFVYDDKAPWPTLPDGFGYTLTLIAPSTNPDHGDPHSWRASFALEGTPGGTDRTAPPGGSSLADTDGDGLSDLANYALAGGPTIDFSGNTVTFDRSTAADARAVVEFSTDLGSWTPVGTAAATYTTISPTVERLTVTLPPPGVATRRYLRLKILGP